MFFPASVQDSGGTGWKESWQASGGNGDWNRELFMNSLWSPLDQHRHSQSVDVISFLLRKQTSGLWRARWATCSSTAWQSSSITCYRICWVRSAVRSRTGTRWLRRSPLRWTARWETDRSSPSLKLLQTFMNSFNLNVPLLYLFHKYRDSFCIGLALSVIIMFHIKCNEKYLKNCIIFFLCLFNLEQNMIWTCICKIYPNAHTFFI